jgi:hypothetical protein
LDVMIKSRDTIFSHSLYIAFGSLIQDTTILMNLIICCFKMFLQSRILTHIIANIQKYHKKFSLLRSASLKTRHHTRKWLLIWYFTLIILYVEQNVT